MLNFEFARQWLSGFHVGSQIVAICYHLAVLCNVACDA